MTRHVPLATASLLALLCALPVGGQEKGNWRAASTTARGITGDIAFAGEKIVINFAAFTVAQIRDLTPAETSAAFNSETAAGGSGSLYRTDIPGDKKFLHKNTLCGGEDTQWIVTYAAGHTLQVALFSGPSMPVLTAEAVANATNLCGTYTYVR